MPTTAAAIKSSPESIWVPTKPQTSSLEIGQNRFHRFLSSWYRVQPAYGRLGNRHLLFQPFVPNPRGLTRHIWGKQSVPPAARCNNGKPCGGFAYDKSAPHRTDNIWESSRTATFHQRGKPRRFLNRIRSPSVNASSINLINSGASNDSLFPSPQIRVSSSRTFGSINRCTVRSTMPSRISLFAL